MIWLRKIFRKLKALPLEIQLERQGFELVNEGVITYFRDNDNNVTDTEHNPHDVRTIQLPNHELYRMLINLVWGEEDTPLYYESSEGRSEENWQLKSIRATSDVYIRFSKLRKTVGKANAQDKTSPAFARDFQVFMRMDY